VSRNEVRIVVTGDSRDAERAFRQVNDSANKSKTDLIKAFDEGGKTSVKKMSQPFGGFGGIVSPQLAAAGVVAGAAFSAPAAAAITAGLLGALGGGVLIAGIKSASSGPRVKAAWGGLSKSAAESFKDFGKPFEGPVLDAIETFGKAIRSLAPDFNEMGASIAPVIGPLAQGLRGLFENAMPGLKEALKSSVALFDVVAKRMPDIGTAISDSLKSMADGGKGATDMLNGSISALLGTLRGTAKAVGWLSEKFGQISENERTAIFLKGLGKVFSGLGHTIRNIFGPELGALGEQFGSLEGTVHNNRKEINQLLSALRKTGNFIENKVAPVIGTLLAGEIRIAGKTIRTLVSAVGAGTRAFNSMKNTATNAGARTRSAMSSTLSRVRSVAHGIHAAFGGIFGPLTSGARSAASRARSAMSSLLSSVRHVCSAIRSAVSGVFGGLGRSARSAASSARGALGGLASTISRLQSAMSHLPGFVEGGATGYAAGGVLSRAAYGGPRNGLVRVGEAGPETLDMRSGTIYPTANQRIRGQAGGGAQEITINLVIDGHGQLGQALARELRKHINVNGGNVQTVLGRHVS
jgi:hypothetical protein